VIALRAARLVRRYRLEGILTIQGDIHFVVGAYVAARITHVPLFLFSMDSWRGNSLYPSRLHDVTAAIFEPRVLRRSRARWAISPFLINEWRERYGVEGVCCWHSVDIDAFNASSAAPVPCIKAPILSMLGSVYSVNIEEVLRLVEAGLRLRERLQAPLEIRFLTTQSAEQVAAEGIPMYPWVKVQSIAREDVPEALAAADIVFLGLSFSPRFRHLGQVAFPTKLAEYLASGRPLVINAPSSSTAVRYVREHACGEVVDRPDIEALVDAIDRLLRDPARRQMLGSRARAIAHANHDRRQVVRQFRVGLKR
jgi:glycosyltransferase involved in cell wall biosynthesis